MFVAFQVRSFRLSVHHNLDACYVQEDLYKLLLVSKESLKRIPTASVDFFANEELSIVTPAKFPSAFFWLTLFAFVSARCHPQE